MATPKLLALALALAGVIWWLTGSLALGFVAHVAVVPAAVAAGRSP